MNRIRSCSEQNDDASTDFDCTTLTADNIEDMSSKTSTCDTTPQSRQTEIEFSSPGECIQHSYKKQPTTMSSILGVDRVSEGPVSK